MSNTITSPDMSLPIPVVNTDPGPDYANNINACLLTIDSHNHSSGSGVQITPNGLNINADLSFGSNNATSLRSVRFAAQGSPLAVGTDLGCLYESGVDLYYNDGNGNQVRITQSGGIAGSPGSIGNLTSPASATYVSATPAFVWQSDASTAAGMDGGPVTIRKLTASSPGITIEAPSGLSADYTMILPTTLPGATSFVTLDNTGVLGATISTTQGITRSMLAPLGQATSSSCGVFSTSSTSYVTVTNLSISLTTTGRPVFLMMQGSSGNGGATFSIPSGGTLSWAFYRDSTLLSEYQFFDGFGSNTASFPFAGLCLDTVSAGTYTYTIKAKVSTSTGSLIDFALNAWEL